MNGCAKFDTVSLRDTIRVVHNDLFPKAKELNIDTVIYMDVVFAHKRITKEDKEFLKNGVKWLNEEAVATHKKVYAKLTALQRQEVLGTISKLQWGDSWIYNMMTYIFEAMLGDPIYGGNNNQAGWKWLSFQGGLPRPTKVYI